MSEEKKKRGRKPRTLSPTPAPEPSVFDVERERKRLLGFAVQTGDVIEKTLAGLLSGKEPVSGALLGSLVDSVKKVGQLLEDLEKQEAERARQARLNAELSPDRLPFQQSPRPLPRPALDGPPITLPFPTGGFTAAPEPASAAAGPSGGESFDDPFAFDPEFNPPADEVALPPLKGV